MNGNDFFKHFLWKRHEHPHAWRQSLPELITSDGAIVRRLVSQSKYIYFQAFEDRDTASQIVDRVETSVASGMALLGYSMFADDAAVAILHMGQGEESGWVAFPHKRIERSVIPTLPLRVADFPKLRLVGGASLDRKNGKPRIVVALEQRGETFQSTEYAMNILEHVEEVTLMAKNGVGDDAKEVRLINRNEDVAFNRVSPFRIEAKFPVHEALVREFSEKADLSVWIRVQFDRKLISLPEDWRRFWMSVDVPGLTPT